MGTFRQGIVGKLGEAHPLAQQLADLQADLAGWVARATHSRTPSSSSLLGDLSAAHSRATSASSVPTPAAAAASSPSPVAPAAPSPQPSEDSFAFSSPGALTINPMAGSTSDSLLHTLPDSPTLLPVPAAHSAPLPSPSAGASSFAGLASSPYALQLSEARSSSGDGDGGSGVEVTVLGPAPAPKKGRLSLSQAFKEKLRLFSSKAKSKGQGQEKQLEALATDAGPLGSVALGSGAVSPKSGGSATPRGSTASLHKTSWASCMAPPEVLQEVQ